MSILAELDWRGLIADCTDQVELAKRTTSGPITLYCGFDPTSDSLHVGHLMGQMMLRRFQLAGHHPVPLAGGATGQIGDPSGKATERQLLTREQIDHNVSRIKEQLSRILDFSGKNPARLVDNASWTAPLTLLNFLRDVGKHFSVNVMMQKESVRARMEDRESGISYTEFSYMLLQANDFYHLRNELNCELQVGGSDQWGNITAGIDLIRRKMGQPAFGLTFPLLTKADGTKFGKTESGAVWLDSKKTSPYRFYQFFIQSDDGKVIDYLKMLTLMSREEIMALEEKHRSNPGARDSHKALARAVTTLVHGEHVTQEAIRASDILFGGDLQGVSESTFNEIVGEVPTREIARTSLDGAGVPLVELLVQSGLSTSKGQARKDIEGGGAYVNNIRESNFQRAVTTNDLLFGKHLLLRKGKKNYVVVTPK